MSDSDGAGYALRPLDEALEQDLSRGAVREWLSPKQTQALHAPEKDPGAALGAVGRLIRSGDLTRASRQRLDDWWRSVAHGKQRARALVTALETTALSLASTAKTLLSHASPSFSTLVAARDDAESALVALGQAALCEVEGAAESERRLAEALREVDAAADAREEELQDAFCRAGDDSRDAWLSRVSRLDDSPWWCQLLTARDLRANPKYRRAVKGA